MVKMFEVVKQRFVRDGKPGTILRETLLPAFLMVAFLMQPDRPMFMTIALGILILLVFIQVIVLVWALSRQLR